jgi:ADP-L-glycero-D-manno-heptose 6-epimerase
MFVITGGAGFIGSNIAASLDKDGHEIVIVDSLGSDDLKWRNIAKRRVFDIVTPNDNLAFIKNYRSRIEGVIHMGAISTTTERDVDAIVRNNLRLSIDLWNICSELDIPLVYASSAATYGDGSAGFFDRSDPEYFAKLAPLNAYGWSKHVFDRWVQRRIETGDPAPPRWAGIKFFNVYGPNEYHKGDQRSVAAQLHQQIRSEGVVKLFKSDNPSYKDGEQLRDFVWVGDCVNIVRWAMEDPDAKSGLYNSGSGHARSFREKAEICFRALGLEPDIHYVDLPPALMGKYQYYTCANLDKLRKAGYTQATTSLEDGLKTYLLDYLEKEDRFC